MRKATVRIDRVVDREAVGALDHGGSLDKGWLLIVGVILGFILRSFISN